MYEIVHQYWFDQNSDCLMYYLLYSRRLADRVQISVSDLLVNVKLSSHVS